MVLHASRSRATWKMSSLVMRSRSVIRPNATNGHCPLPAPPGPSWNGTASAVDGTVAAQDLDRLIQWQRLDGVTTATHRRGAKEGVVHGFLGRFDHSQKERR